MNKVTGPFKNLVSKFIYPSETLVCTSKLCLQGFVCTETHEVSFPGNRVEPRSSLGFSSFQNGIERVPELETGIPSMN